MIASATVAGLSRLLVTNHICVQDRWRSVAEKVGRFGGLVRIQNRRSERCM